MVRKSEIKVLEVPADSDGSCKLQINGYERVEEYVGVRNNSPKLKKLGPQYIGVDKGRISEGARLAGMVLRAAFTKGRSHRRFTSRAAGRKIETGA